jgi:hypothetical protein
MTRIRYAKEEVHRFHEDVGLWKESHDHLAEDRWIWEDIIAKANFLFGRIIDLDADIQEQIFAGRIDLDLRSDEEIREILQNWLAVSFQVVPHAERLEREYGVVDGANALRGNIDQAKKILTPDEVYFRDDKLVSLRDLAIEAHRSGLTEPLLDNGQDE